MPELPGVEIEHKGERLATVSRAAAILGVSETTVRRRVERGTLAHTTSPEALERLPNRPGVPATLLIRLEQKQQGEGHGASPRHATTDIVSQLEAETESLEAENAELRAEVARLKEVLQLELSHAESISARVQEAESMRRAQLQQFLVQDFVND